MAPPPVSASAHRTAVERPRYNLHDPPHFCWPAVEGVRRVTLLRFVLLLAHVVAGAVWLGAMAYSLGVVQARVRALFDDPVRAEEVAVFMAAGARWKVIGVMAILAATGGGLALVGGRGHSTWWQIAIGTKGVLLVVAAAVFAWVSWRLWPARVFALPEEVPGWQRRFQIVGATLLGLVSAEFVLGIAAHVIG